MAWRVWHFITLVLVALLLGTTFGHALEMPMKMNVDGRLWLTFQHTLYPYFAYIGAPVEIGAIISLGILSFFARHRSRSFYLVLTATLCVATAFFVVWLGFTNPVNAETAKWTTDAVSVRLGGVAETVGILSPRPFCSALDWVWCPWDFLGVNQPGGYLTQSVDRGANG
jgi:hypothetical protein